MSRGERKQSMIMNRFRKLVITVVYCMLQAYAFTEESISVSIGDTDLAIPNPSGFEPVTDEMTQFSEILTHFLSPTNDRLAFFISEEDAVIARTGEFPDVFRRFDVQTPKNLAGATISPRQFGTMKRLVISQHESIFDRLENQAKEELLKRISEALAAEDTPDLAFPEFDLLPLPPHHESEQLVALSIIHSSEISDGDEVVTSLAKVLTLTLLYLEGKVLFLYVHGEPSSLEWTREESRKWAEEIISLNPQP